MKYDLWKALKVGVKLFVVSIPAALVAMVIMFLVGMILALFGTVGTTISSVIGIIVWFASMGFFVLMWRKWIFN